MNKSKVENNIMPISKTNLIRYTLHTSSEEYGLVHDNGDGNADMFWKPLNKMSKNEVDSGYYKRKFVNEIISDLTFDTIRWQECQDLMEGASVTINMDRSEYSERQIEEFLNACQKHINQGHIIPSSSYRDALCPQYILDILK